MKHLAFAIENNVGNATYRRNLEQFVGERGESGGFSTHQQSNPF